MAEIVKNPLSGGHSKVFVKGKHTKKHVKNPILLVDFSMSDDNFDLENNLKNAWGI
jgi:CheY-specific phosphatase CheX